MKRNFTGQKDRMARQLAVFLDGTNNRFSHRPTNVMRLLQSTARSADLLVYYDQGVGTFGLKETLFEWQKVPSRVGGLLFGWGLKRNVEDAYRFLAQNAAQDDEVYLFGFSRGAYAVRALAALIHAVGLVAPYETHLFDYAWSMLLARTGRQGEPDFDLQCRFKSTFGRTRRIRLLGLFDTVKSVGWIYDPVVMPYSARNPSVDAVRHAVSVDERRCFFRQHLWKHDASVATDVKELWFAGVHADVGGGYQPESAQLALIAYRWMVGEALAAGLRLDRSRCREQLSAAAGVHPDPAADMHDSMTRWWKTAEWLPRHTWTGEGSRYAWSVGAMPPLGQPPPRLLPAGALLHRSVEQRLQTRADYRPPNLPAAMVFVDDDPGVSDLGG